MSRRHRQSPLVPIVFLLLVFGRSAFRFSYRTVRAIVRSVTSGVSINLHKLLEPSSILGSVAIGVIIGLVFYYIRYRKKSREEAADAEAEIEEEEQAEPFCPPIMTNTAADSSEEDYNPPMYRRSGS